MSTFNPYSQSFGTGGGGSGDATSLQGYPISADVPAEGDVLTFIGGEWVPSASQAVGGYVTIGPTLGQYASVKLANDAGKTRMYVIQNTTETADCQFLVSESVFIYVLQGIQWTKADTILNVNNSLVNIVLDGYGTIGYAFTGAKNLVSYQGTANGDLTVRNLQIVNTSTVDDCYFNGAPASGQYRQQFSNLLINLPNQAGCGLRIFAGQSNQLTFVGGGSDCGNALSVSGGSADGLRFTGTFSSSTAALVVTEASASNVYCGSASGTPLIRIDANGMCKLDGVIAKADAGIRIVTLGAGVVINAFESGVLGSFFLGAGSDGTRVNNSVIKDATIGANDEKAKFTGVYFSQTSALTISALASTFTDCDFACDVTVSADFVTLDVPHVGDTNGGTKTISVGGVNQVSIISPITEADIVDGGTDTGIANPRKW